MAATQEVKKDPVVVVLQLTGGNDYLNTAIPYNNPLYRDNCKAVGIPDNQVMHLDPQYGIPHYMAPIKQFWDEGKLAIVHGVGWKESPRSHFRAMDIWHTCEPIKVGTEGWLGRVAREFDPNKQNVVTTVSFGPSLPRALACPGVLVACVGGPLENYGFLPTIQGEQRRQILERFAAMYKPAIGTGAVMDYMAETGVDSLKGEDILKVAPQKYSSTVEYPNTPIARKLKGIAQVHLAALGSRIFYCDHSTFDTHAGQNPGHGVLWTAVTEGLDAFMKDLRQHDHADNIIVLMFSEFGRRARDNGSGTDHGAGGVVFALGEKVKGGHYGEMPSLEASKLVQGDLDPNMDFRSVYSTVLDKWLGLNPAPIDWSHAVGHNAQRGPGFNYVQTMSLGKNGVIYTANRGANMHCNKIQLGGPHEEEWLADFCEGGEGDGTCTRPFSIAVDNDKDHVYVSDDWRNTISVFDTAGNFIRKWGKTGSGDGELMRPAGLAVEKNGNVIVVDSGNNRLQVFTPEGQFVGKCGRGGSGDGEFNNPWGITLDKDGNIYVADWKNHRVQKSSPEGKFLMKFGEYGKVEAPEGAFAVTHFGPYVSAGGSETAHYPKSGLLNHPTDVAVDPDGDIYVTDWGNHRVCIFGSEGRPIANLIGDAQVLSKWGQQRVDANPDMAKARRRVKSLEPQWRFCFPTAVEFDRETDQIIVADSMRNRLQVYQKVRDYSDFQANL